MKYWHCASRTYVALLLLLIGIEHAIGQQASASIDEAPNEDIAAVDSINARAGVAIVYASTNASDKDSNRVRATAIIETLGIGITIPIYENLITFEPALDFGFINLRFDNSDTDNSSLNATIPQNFFNPRNNSYTGTLVLLLSLPIELQFSVDQYLLIGLGVSPTINLRLPIVGTDQQEISDITAYYTSNGRFFTPESYVRVGYRFADVHINALIRALWPVYNGWDVSGISFLHDLYLIGNIQVQFAL